MLFVDFEKAADSLEREAMWRILGHYSVPDDKVTNVIKVQYRGFTWQVLHGETMSKLIEVKAGVRQECLFFYPPQMESSWFQKKKPPNAVLKGVMC